MTISIVAGGAGFIGTNLCEKLLKKGHDVVCIDSLITGQKRNIDYLKEQFNQNFSFLQADIVELSDRQKDAFKNCNFIYNLACPASPKSYQVDPIHTFKTSVDGTYNLLELATHTKARLLLTSTSEVYGDPLEHPQEESYRGNVNFIGPRACYDVGKRAAECLMFDYSRIYQTNICVARIFNTFGPRMASDDGRVVSNFIMQALRGEDITVYGKGNQTRSLCYVDDTVSGLVSLMENDKITGPVNLGSIGELTVLEIAELIIKLTKSNSKIVHLPLPIDDPKKRKPDISLAKEKLNWQPSVILEDGLQKTIAYFRKFK